MEGEAMDRDGSQTFGARSGAEAENIPVYWHICSGALKKLASRRKTAKCPPRYHSIREPFASERNVRPRRSATGAPNLSTARRA